MFPSSTKLSSFQAGLAQKIAIFCVYFISLTIIVLILDFFDKKIFLNIVNEIYKQGSISEQTFNSFTGLIESRDGFLFFNLIFIGTICECICFLIIKQIAKLQWSKSITLPKVIEFNYAMQNIGIDTTEDRIDFAYKKRIPIFIASKPFIKEEQDNISVRLYAFSYHPIFSNKNIFNIYIGQQRLCIDAADYEYLLQQYGQKAISAYITSNQLLKEEKKTPRRNDLDTG